MVNASRRGFFRGRVRPQAALRPPWALVESEFIDCCTRCNECLNVCPEAIIASGDGGFPVIDFKLGECTFCAACVTACQPQALKQAEGSPPWQIKAVIGPSCLPERGVECRVCDDYCGANAIRFSPRLGSCPLPEIEAARCTGCGACIAPCPTSAITIKA